MNRILVSAALALLAAANAGAETAYVTDLLRLGIHRAPDTSDRAFDSLISGTALEVLESSVNYARVRTSEGQEGWVKAAYLVAEKPARLRVAEVEAELETLRAKLDAAQTARAAAEQQARRIEQEVLADENSAAALRKSVDSLRRENSDYASRLERYRASLPLNWVLPALVLTLIAGFAAGWWWLDASIRRRHGGYRIY
ncbi:MAG: TIGR04211 family SH3 domain-containing protein [Gammaproteobacteria bacterium]|nr:TIGR04211 family SH3 domain-containing protein [Gammaproteobacteria bacterium]